MEDADLGLVGGPTMTFWPAPAAPPHEVAAAGVAPGPGVGGVGDNAALPKAGALAPRAGPRPISALPAPKAGSCKRSWCQLAIAAKSPPRFCLDTVLTSLRLQKHEELGKQAKANLLLASSTCLLFFVVCKWNKPATNCYESMVHQKI